MRTFVLQDKNGVSYNLTEKQTAFLYNVDGLGFSRDIEYQPIGDGYAAVSNVLAQGVISGVVRFRQPNAYQKYFAFVQFTQNAPLKLIYTPTTTPYYRDGMVTSISKSESRDGALTCNVEFSATSPFYKLLYEFNDGVVSGGKEYNYSYNYVYANAIAETVMLQCDSYLSCPAKIEIYGYAVNPMWRHYVNGVLISSGAVTATVAAGNKLVIDTTTNPYSIKQYNLANELISDAYQLSDFSTQRFVTLKNGRNTISVSHEGSNVLQLGVEARIEYASV